jgi:hypothetical protein
MPVTHADDHCGVLRLAEDEPQGHAEQCVIGRAELVGQRGEAVCDRR